MRPPTPPRVHPTPQPPPPAAAPPPPPETGWRIIEATDREVMSERHGPGGVYSICVVARPWR